MLLAATIAFRAMLQVYQANDSESLDSRTKVWAGEQTTCPMHTTSNTAVASWFENPGFHQAAYSLHWSENLPTAQYHPDISHLARHRHHDNNTVGSLAALVAHKSPWELKLKLNCNLLGEGQSFLKAALATTITAAAAASRDLNRSQVHAMAATHVAHIPVHPAGGILVTLQTAT